MSEISREEMREWLHKEKGRRVRVADYFGEGSSCHEEIKIIDAILSELDGPSEEERREMWHWIESWRNLCRAGMVHGCDKCKLTENGQPSKPICDEYHNKIRKLILGKEKP